MRTRSIFSQPHAHTHFTTPPHTAPNHTLTLTPPPHHNQLGPDSVLLPTTRGDKEVIVLVNASLPSAIAAAEVIMPILYKAGVRAREVQSESRGAFGENPLCWSTLKSIRDNVVLFWEAKRSELAER